MIFGGYGEGGEDLPRVVRLSVSRYERALPRAGRPLDFLVSIHEEGTGLTWQQNATLDPDTERAILDATAELHAWSLRLALTPDRAKARAEELGAILHEVFVGRDGQAYLDRITPTAVLMGVDETILSLPWELLRTPGGVLSQQTPFGRLVGTRTIPRPPRDPLQQDRVVRILAVVNPTSDLGVAGAEIEGLGRIQRGGAPFEVEVDVLERDGATRSRFREMLAAGDYDILHFAGHGSFDPKAPEQSALRFADGLLPADEVPELPWAAPPGLVFNSACESGRAAGGRRLVSEEGDKGNGLAAAFLAAGAAAYAGYFWPVTDVGARLFAEVFYRALFERENVGVAFQEARRTAVQELGGDGDLTGYSAVLFGDAASKHRQDLATAA